MVMRLAIMVEQFRSLFFFAFKFWVVGRDRLMNRDRILE